MKVKPAAVKKSTKRKKPGKMAKQLKKMNGTSKLEDLFEEILVEMGVEYVHHYRLGGREFDFCLTDHNILIEIHGCFWHACPVCGEDAKFSAQKRSVKNDRHKVKLVEAAKGYTMLTFWEHEVHKERAKVVMTIIEALA